MHTLSINNTSPLYATKCTPNTSTTTLYHQIHDRGKIVRLRPGIVTFFFTQKTRKPHRRFMSGFQHKNRKYDR